MKNVLFVSGLAGDTRRYRCLHHQEQLALHDIASTLRTADDFASYVDITTCDLLILHRVAYSPLVADLIELAHLRGVPVVFETDDLVFEPALISSIAFLDTLSVEAANRFRQDLHGQAKTFAHSDFVLVTTDYLAQAAARHGKPVFVQRNACSAEMIQTAEAAYELRHASAERDPTAPIVLGYFSGTGSHNRDFLVATPALLEIMARYPQVWLHVSGHLDLDSRFTAFRERIRRAPFVAWQELSHLVAQVDINLAPLELDNPFCQAKSEIKYSEAALVGVPTIASPTEAFTFAIESGVNGLLAADDAEWLAALTQVVEDEQERRRVGETARKRVYAEYTPEARSQSLVATLGQITEQFVPSAADPARVPTVLAAAMKRQLDQAHEQQAQQARQLEQLRQTVASWEAKSTAGQTDFWQRTYAQIESQQVEALQTILARLQNAEQSSS